HDARADYRSDQQRGPEGFGGKPARQIEFGHQLAFRMPNIPPTTLRVAAGRGGSSRDFGNATRTRLPMRYAGISFTGAITVIGALTGREEGFPRHTRRVVDPGFFGLGIAADGCSLLDDVAAGLVKPRIDLLQFPGVLDLNSEMIEAGLLASGGDRKIHPRVL